MKPDVVESWVFGVIVLALLVMLHWLAFRIGEKRRRTKRRLQAGAQRARGMSGRQITDDPVTPK